MSVHCLSPESHILTSPSLMLIGTYRKLWGIIPEVLKQLIQRKRHIQNPFTLRKDQPPFKHEPSKYNVFIQSSSADWL